MKKAEIVNYHLR